MLLLVAFLEVAINRVAVPILRPAHGAPPAWHTALDYFGLFLFYFAGTLAAVLAGAHAVRQLRAGGIARERIASVAFAAAVLLAALPLFVPVPGVFTFALEVAFATAMIALVASAFARDRDLGVQLGLIVVAMPLLVHTANVLGGKYLWPESVFDAQGESVTRAGVMALCVAALVSPYVFSPRPFARSVTRVGPVLFAMSVAAGSAIVARTWYPAIAKAAMLAIGVELNESHADPRLAIYLLAVATLAWTLASCALAASAARRQIGAGIAFVVLGGYGFRWPNHYLLPLFGLALIADAARRVRDEELAAMPLSSDTPPIADAAWGAFVTTLKKGLEHTLGEVHTLTTRGDGGLASTVILGDHQGRSVRARIERLDASVVVLDVVVGREVSDARDATLTLWAIPPRALGANPAAPAAAPPIESGDAPFDERFRTRGSAGAFAALFDAELRARAIATLDGWLAYWERDGLRYRVYPGRGAPLDHPLPLSDLALGRTASADRFVAVIDLLVAIAARGVPVPEAPPQAPESAA